MIENTLARRDNENKFEHHKRLVYGKLKDKTLADYDYGEISQYLYGRDYAPDETRKRMYGSLSTLELLDELGVQNITEEDVLNELDAKRIELQKERQRFFDQRREFNKLVNEEGRREHIYEKLTEAAYALPNAIGTLELDVDNSYQEYSDAHGILVFSDWHFGMTTNNVFNTYNTEICKDRVLRVVRETMDRLVLHKCRKLTIVVLGDLVHGQLLSSMRVASEELVADQLMQASELLAQAILILCQCVDELDVYVTYGNHARTVANKKDSIHRDNLERIIPWWLKSRVAAECSSLEAANNIVVHDDSENEFILFDACGYTFCATHGDLDSVRTAGRQLSVLFQQIYNKTISAVILGDKHHNESFEELGVDAMICGSLCGPDEYANAKRLYSKPSQLLLIVNPRDCIDAKYELRCDY